MLIIAFTILSKNFINGFFDFGIVLTIPVIKPIIRPIIVPVSAISIVYPIPCRKYPLYFTKISKTSFKNAVINLFPSCSRYFGLQPQCGSPNTVNCYFKSAYYSSVGAILTISDIKVFCASASRSARALLIFAVRSEPFLTPTATLVSPSSALKPVSLFTRGI